MTRCAESARLLEALSARERELEALRAEMARLRGSGGVAPGAASGASTAGGLCEITPFPFSVKM
jgi:hypothetical protein